MRQGERLSTDNSLETAMEWPIISKDRACKDGKTLTVHSDEIGEEDIEKITRHGLIDLGDNKYIAFTRDGKRALLIYK
ncbi:hypothetical protein HOD30_02560 [Candidatus Peregrinibacteria bacterium]|jgi:hypothetical protein|nr:hypothetical protein [Candidatus Peregrinibacteria bacterium]MBT4631550.1 hypothetical protein [Candidatus Peregrinibacteria bacterium]MBT5823535.1 hypothetical protein [Candidatus Peregrinibacteria bacterium]